MEIDERLLLLPLIQPKFGNPTVMLVPLAVSLPPLELVARMLSHTMNRPGGSISDELRTWFEESGLRRLTIPGRTFGFDN